MADASVTRDKSDVYSRKARQRNWSRAILMAEKAFNISWVQLRSSAHFLPPFRTAVRGRRIFAATGMKGWEEFTSNYFNNFLHSAHI